MDYLATIYEFLTIKDIVKCKITNKEISSITESNYMWKIMTERDFNQEYMEVIESTKMWKITERDYNSECINNNIDYKKKYIELHKEKKILETFKYKNFPDTMDEKIIKIFLDIFKEKIIVIDYSYNEVDYLYGDIDDIEERYNLYLSEYKYKENIKVIYIHNDCINDIPSNISQFNNLKRLIVEGSRLMNLDNINLLPNSLEYLWIKGGNIPFYKISDQLGHLKNLIYLDLDDLNNTFDIDYEYIHRIYDQFCIDSDGIQGEELKLLTNDYFDTKQILPFIPSLRIIKLEADECSKINLYVLKCFFNEFLKNYPNHEIKAYGYFDTENNKITITSDLSKNKQEEEKYYSDHRYHIYDITIFP